MKIDKRAKIELCVSVDKMRPPLLNPYLDMPDGKPAVVVATDGRKMAVVPVEAEPGTDKPGYLSAEALKAARKTKASEAVIACTTHQVLLDGRSFSRPTEDELGNFPTWRQVVPDEKEKVEYRIGLNARYLWELAQAIGSDGNVTLAFHGDTAPMRVTASAIEGAFGILMPVRMA